MVGFAFDDHQVVARAFEAHAPGPAGVRIEHGAGQRRLGADRKTVTGLEAGARDRTSGDDQHIFRRQRLNLRANEIPQQARANPATADILLGDLQIERLGCDLPSGKVNYEGFSRPAIHIVFPLWQVS